jgi:hydrogenase maturation protease
MRAGGATSGSPGARVLALGNPERGDDGAGPAVARRLRERLGDGTALRRIDLRRVGGEVTEILAAWEGAERVIAIDAVRTGAPPGTIHRFEDTDLPGDLKSSPSSHGLGLAHAVALGRTLGRLPASLAIYGIEACSFEPGAPLHPEVERAVEHLTRELVEELAAAPAEWAEKCTPHGGRPSGGAKTTCRPHLRPCPPLPRLTP